MMPIERPPMAMPIIFPRSLSSENVDARRPIPETNSFVFKYSFFAILFDLQTRKLQGEIGIKFATMTCFFQIIQM